MPASIAVRMMWMLSASERSGLPRWTPPRPIAETRSPVRPSVRIGTLTSVRSECAEDGPLPPVEAAPLPMLFLHQRAPFGLSADGPRDAQAREFVSGPVGTDPKAGHDPSRSANVLLQGFSVLMKRQVDVRKPEGQPDQSHNQQSDGEQDQSWLQQQHRISDEPKQVSFSLDRPALDRVQRIRERERVEEESRIDQREDRHSDDDQGDLEKNRVDLTGSKARLEKEQQERENRDARSDERHDTADVKIGGLIPHRGPSLATPPGRLLNHQNGYEGFHFQAELTSSRTRRAKQRRSRSRRLSARFFPSDFIDDLRHRREPVIRPEKFDRVSRGHIALFADREVKSRTAAREEPPHHVRPPEPDPELVTGHPRLCHLQQGRPDAQPVSDAERPLVETFRREILAERSPRKIRPPEFAPPEGIVFARVGIDGLRGASVDGRVRLAVADEAGSPDPDTALHRLLEDRRRDFAASPFDCLRQGYVYGDDAHGIRPHGFRPMSARYPPRFRG